LHEKVINLSKKIRVLFAGESLYFLTTIFKGRDNFDMGSDVENGRYLIEAFKANDIDYDYLPTYKVTEEFPWTLDELKQYDAIIVSDVGSDTFLVSQRTLLGEKTPNRLDLIEQYVREGGGFLMWGGYFSFTGNGSKGFYKGTPIERLLPVTLMDHDDRVEVPEGFEPIIKMPNHPILDQVPEKWDGWFLSYNRLKAKNGANVLAVIPKYGDDPFLVAGEYGSGRVLASAVDCSRHGASPKFLDWEYKNIIYGNMIKWICKQI
jgi:uncharacterized membrane protein